jgi:carboxyl-terminal PDZ ligand of neuronal nitric oxide synthase protein
MHNQKSNDFMQNDDMKNNNSPNKSNLNGNLGGALNLESFQIFQNTMQAYNHLQKLSMPQQHQELYQLNQELLNRLKNLNVGFQTPSTPVSAPFTPSPTTGLPNFPTDSNFMFTNAGAHNFLNNNNNNNSNNNNINNSQNNNNNMIASSPLGTLNRSSSTYSTISPIGDSFDRSLDNINNNNINNNDSAFIKPLSQVGTVTTLDNDGKVKVLVPVDHQQQSQSRDRDRYRIEEDFFGDRRGGGGGNTLHRPPNQQRALTPILSRGEKKGQGNTVTLKVTDEAGNVTNQRKLPAQPSFITRSTSEKVPNRSQMMSHVQRTQWARHTTK